MATRTTVTLICDRPHQRETVADGVVRFTFGGEDQEIDLCAACRGELAVAAGPFLAAARRSPAAQRAGTAQRRRPAHTKAAIGQARQLREWARTHGWPQLGTHGRVPAAAIAAWEARDR